MNYHHYTKQRMRALVRDNFTCQFMRTQYYIPSRGRCSKEEYQRTMSIWRKIKLTAVAQCTCYVPQYDLTKLEVHHIIPKRFFRKHQLEQHDPSNLITLCHEHHQQLHERLEYHARQKKKELQS